MTCIAALIDKNIVWIGGDTCGSDLYDYTTGYHSKVFKNGEFLFGGTTSFRMLDLLQYVFNPPYIEKKDEEDFDKYMRTKFIDNFRKCLSNGGFLEKKNEVEQGGNFLVGFRDKLFEIQSDFSVLNPPKWGSAVGCGHVAAKASLYTTVNLNIFSPEERIKKALETSEAINCHVRGPFTIFNTENLNNG